MNCAELVQRMEHFSRLGKCSEGIVRTRPFVEYYTYKEKQWRRYCGPGGQSERPDCLARKAFRGISDGEAAQAASFRPNSQENSGIKNLENNPEL